MTTQAGRDDTDSGSGADGADQSALGYLMQVIDEEVPGRLTKAEQETLARRVYQEFGVSA